MKSFSYFPLMPYFFKYIGMMLALAGLALFLKGHTEFQHMFYAGLLIMTFSQEKNESEMSGLVRAESFKTVLGYTLSLFIALHLTALLSERFTLEMTPYLYLGLPLVVYQLIFYVTMLLRVKVDSATDLEQNIRNNKRFYVVWSLLTLAVTLIFAAKIMIG